MENFMLEKINYVNNRNSKVKMPKLLKKKKPPWTFLEQKKKQFQMR